MSSDSSTVLKQQLYEAVLVLASEEGKIEERLAHAYFEHIQALGSASFPADTRPEYDAICAELKQMYPQRGKTDGVDRSAAVNLAMRIILIYDSMIK